MSAGVHTYRGDGATRAGQLAGASKLRQERNRACLLIGLLLLCQMASAVAIWRLADVHTVIPVVTVIDANGHVVKQSIVEKDSIAGHESVMQSQVHDFVTYCNTFDPAWRQHYADLCRLHATPEVARQYDAETTSTNPDNPYYQIGRQGRRYPRITGITPLGGQTYQVAFQSITERAGAEPTTDYYTALVRYALTRRPLALGDRWVNPLGFAATAYRKDQELAHR